jgi:UDP-N-acetylglucosamine 3-dehydrogenase
MSDRLEDARRMLDAAEKSDAVLSVGFMLHFNPGLLRLKELIDDGVLGRVMAVQYKVGSYITLVNSQSRYQADMQGALLMDYAHQPDTIHWLLGSKPLGVYCTGATGGDMEFSSDPNVLTLVCDYEEPLVATIMLNYLQMPERQECEVVGDRGWALLDFKQGEIRIGNKQNDDIASESFSVVRDEMYRKEHQVFLDAMEGKGQPSSPAEEAIVSMEIIEAAMISRQIGQRVPL